MTLTSPQAYRLLSAALLWVSPDSARKNLHQIRIECDGAKVSIASTDGHGLWLCEQAPFEGVPQETFSLGIVADDARAIIRFITQRKETRGRTAYEPVRITKSGDGWTIGVGRLRCDLEPVYSDFPKVRSVIPKQRERHDYVGMSAALLAKAARSLPGRNRSNQDIRIRAGGVLEPIRLDGWVAETAASVIVMPLRLSEMPA